MGRLVSKLRNFATAALVLVLVALALPAGAAITVANATSCVTASGAGRNVACAIPQPAAGNLLFAVAAGAGGAICTPVFTGATIVDTTPGACYQAAYFMVGPDPITSINLLNPGPTPFTSGQPTIAIEVLELAGVAMQSVLFRDVHTQYAGSVPCVVIAPFALLTNVCVAAALTQNFDNEAAISYAVTKSAVTLGTAATFPDSVTTLFSAVTAAPNPLRIDVQIGPAPGLGQGSLYGGFSYSGTASAAAGMTFLRATGP